MRIAVVCSIGVLLTSQPPGVRTSLVVLLVAATAYAGIVFAYPALEVRRTSYRWAITGLDSLFTLTFVALTGGAQSPVVSVLVLVVIASAARLTFSEAIVSGVLLGTGFVAVAILPSEPAASALSPTFRSVWWAVYLVFAAFITAGLSSLAERERRSSLRAMVEAEAEHAVAEEERDLRRRLLASYQAQQDGLQVLVHEFRTPITSLEALTAALTSKDHMTESDRAASVQLTNRHAQHLHDMIDALSDVALSRHPTFATGRVRPVDVADVITVAASTVGLTSPRLQLSMRDAIGTVRLDAQGLRRVLTNLLDNAARHSRDAAVEVTCAQDGSDILITIADRGPGIPPQSQGELTTKYISVGEQRGTAGLGLWIVQQILEAIGGRLDFVARDGGGLIVTARVPAT
ncbi:sensor histidine kinase [Mycolicibacterium septicum]|uniref:sensor histidine kinase n=1 Tax=Mycolicibacterium septicum TaxID=98668 RepID=UPI003CF9873A